MENYFKGPLITPISSNMLIFENCFIFDDTKIKYFTVQ